MGDYEVMDESSNYFGELHFYSLKLDLPMEDLKNSWEIFDPQPLTAVSTPQFFNGVNNLHILNINHLQW